MSEPFEIQEVKLKNISKFMDIDEWYPDADVFGRISTDHLDLLEGTSKPPKKATINDKTVKEDLSIKEGVIFKYFFKEDFNQGRDDNNRPFISNFKHFHDGKLNKDFISHFITRNVLDLKFELDDVGVNPSTHFVKVFDMNIINAIRNYMDKKRCFLFDDEGKESRMGPYAEHCTQSQPMGHARTGMPGLATPSSPSPHILGLLLKHT